MLSHLLNFLFTHGAPEQIGAAEGVAGEQLSGLHHLLLIDQDAVGFLGNLLEQRMLIFDLHLAVASLDEIRDEIHWAGAIERHQRGDVLHRSELKFAAQIAHAAGFQLEHPDGAAFVE